MINFPENVKSTYVVYFAFWDHLSYYQTKNTCGGKFILVKFVGQSRGSLKLILIPK